MTRFLICKAVFDIPALKEKAAELSKKTEDPAFWKNPALAKEVNKEIADANDKINAIDSFLKRLASIQESLEFLKLEMDQEIFEDADNQLTSLKHNFDIFQKKIYYSGKYDANNAIIEFHPGAGGTEAHDWAGMLLRMYQRYCEIARFRYRIVDLLEGEEAGISSATMVVEGKNAYGNLRSENGVHRLVRISPFDAGGSRHTSFASVNVLPEMDENTDIQIDPKDLRIDTYHSSGAGGQNVNKTESAVRITHIPTGVVVSCQVERDQLANKETCMEMLKAKLQAMHDEEVAAKIGGERRLKVGTGERNERIRTYNYPQNRVTDHRIGWTSLNLPKIMDGDLDELVTALNEANQRDLLEEQTKELQAQFEKKE